MSDSDAPQPTVHRRLKKDDQGEILPGQRALVAPAGADIEGLLSQPNCAVVEAPDPIREAKKLRPRYPGVPVVVIEGPEALSKNGASPAENDAPADAGLDRPDPDELVLPDEDEPLGLTVSEITDIVRRGAMAWGSDDGFAEALADDVGFEAAHRYAQRVESWPEDPRVPGFPDPDPLPVDALPSTLAAHVRSVAANLQVPTDLPFLLLLGVLSAALAGKLEVSVRSGWQEVVGLFLAVILPPASRKSPAFEAMTRPLREWEAETVKDVSPRYLAAQDVVDVARKKMDQKKSDMVKGNASSEEVEAARLNLEDARSRVPPDGRLLAGDITPEAMVQRMAAQGGRLAMLEPEPGPIQQLAGRYTDNARLDELKKAWTGETILVDRVTREAVAVHRPALTLGLCLQPGVLEDLQNANAFRTEGVLGRILWCWPRHGLGERLTGDNVPPLNEAASKEYRRILRALLDVESSGRDEVTGALVPHVVEPTRQALDVLHAFEAEVEADLADGGRFASIRDWAGKAVGQAVRIATLLQCAEHAADRQKLPPELIGEGAMESGVRIIRGLVSHALLVLGEIDPRTELLKKTWTRARKLPEQGDLRDLFHSMKGLSAIDGMDDLEPLVDELVELGCLRLRERPSTGGRPPSPLVEIHPELRGDERQSPAVTPDAELAEAIADV